MANQILELLVLAVMLGGIYALVAVGITLIFGVLNIINAAHGEFFAIGGYAALIASKLLPSQAPLGIALGAVAGFALGALAYRFLFEPLRNRASAGTAGPLFLVLTLGLSIFMQSSMLAVAGGDYYRVPPQISGGVDLNFIYLTNQRLMIVVVAVVSLVGLFLFLRYARQGAAIRAVAQNPQAAQAVGIPLTRIFTLTVALGCALAALGGALLTPIINVFPTVGFPLTIKAFAITILGGLGNVLGALLASFLIAAIEVFSIFVIPSEWKDAIAFGSMILVLLVKPNGLLGRSSR